MQKKKGIILLPAIIISIICMILMYKRFTNTKNIILIALIFSNIIIFNMKLIKQKIESEKILKSNMIVIISNLIITSLMFNMLIKYKGLTMEITCSILPAILLNLFINKIDFNNFNKEFCTKISIYYIVPLLVIETFEIFIMNMATESMEMWWNTVYTIYEFDKANICIILTFMLISDIIDSKIKINIKPIITSIISLVMVVVVFGTKIMIDNNWMKEVERRRTILKGTSSFTTLEEYIKLDIDPKIKETDFTKLEKKYQLGESDFPTPESLLYRIEVDTKRVWKDYEHYDSNLSSKKKKKEKKNILEECNKIIESYMLSLDVIEEIIRFRYSLYISIMLTDIIAIIGISSYISMKNSDEEFGEI